ncbi:MAG: hypothetical protein JNK46_04945 [Methylobacteriaceae bacterium]|nr:hypothetical protein [Methylobacteriaceae bacterium]
MAGAFAALAALILGVRSDLSPATAALLVLAAAFLPPLLLDGLPRLRGRAPARFDSDRLIAKLIGALCALGVATLAVAIFPFFHRDELAPLIAAAPTALAVFAPLIAAYVALTDRLVEAPEDGLHALGLAVLGKPFDSARLADFLRTLAIKLFFFTLMFAYLTADIAFYRERGLPTALASHADVMALNRLIFTCDTALAALGYLATLKLFDWHVREADPSASGWAACLVCYEPFFPALVNAFLGYSTGEAWRGVVAEGGAVYWLWVCAVLGCNFVYLLATVAFGPLFSNLTRRRIVTAGPYALTKHPAYLAKNAGWWIADLPGFLALAPVEALRKAAMLACVSAIYRARAVTEERLLAADPVYGAYADHIARHGLVARLRRAFAARLRS